ncbi:MAG: DUF11 domain-containing protein [Anaerolineae bacterium]|nr:DUF11 domain-containing protein [Anaerolineae bacterium]
MILLRKSHCNPGGSISLWWAGRIVLLTALITSSFAQSASPVSAKPLLGPIANISASIPSEVPIGADFTFTVTFDNDNTSPGYGPFIDLAFPVNGADGAAGTDTPDGIDFIGATYLGVPVEATEVTFDVNGEALHPYARGTDGQYLTIYGTPGDKIVSLRLPFGSFVPDQPPATIEVTAHISELADLDTDLSIAYRAGYMFGTNPLDDWCCDPVILQPSGNDSTTDWYEASVRPTLFTLTKTYPDPENETATGPNFPRSYRITATVAGGQSVDNLVISDILPDNLQFLNLVSPSASSCSSLPDTTVPGGTITCEFGTISGSASIVYRYFIPEYTASSYVWNASLGQYELDPNPDNRTFVIDPENGDDVDSVDDASAEADWEPNDDRDLPAMHIISDSTPADHTLTDKSIAIQKTVRNVSDSNNSPGDFLEYTLEFQISDFFAFEGIDITDVFNDGQLFVPSFTPTLVVVEHGVASSAPIDSTNYTVTRDTCPATPGVCSGDTTMVFHVSDELLSRSLDGDVLGGCVPQGGTGGGAPDCDVEDHGGSIATIIFRTQIQDEFTDQYPSGDLSVDQGDTSGNSVDVQANLLSTVDLSPLGASESDGSSASFSISRGSLTKAIYAVNGSTTFDMPLRINAGDNITYRLRYTLPTSDFEDLVISDYLPLPIFDATEVGAVANLTALCDSDGGTADPLAPPAGSACINNGNPADPLDADTYHLLTPPPAPIAPSLQSFGADNKLVFTYGDYDHPTSSPTQIELLFTVTTTDNPFADGLYLTNQANVYEYSTNAGEQTADAIIQIQLSEPYLVTSKGVIATDSPTAVFSPAASGPVTFNAPGTAGKRWDTADVISSNAIAANPIDSNLAGIDGGDLVSFAIVVENQGSGSNGAFDIVVKDDLPAGFVIPGSGINLAVYRGDGVPISYTQLSGGLLGDGIQLDDPGATGVCQHYDPEDGTNIAIITFDLQVDSNIAPNAEITNTGSVTNYAATEGGPDFTGTNADLSDDAMVTARDASATKTLDGSEIATAPNDGNEAVVGELVAFTTELELPEGLLQTLALEDTLDSGLAFVGCTFDPELDVSAGVTAAPYPPGGLLPNVCATPSVDPGGGSFSLSFGDVVNTNSSNGTPETLQVHIIAVVTNVAAASQGTLLRNSATWSYTGGSVSAQSEQVRVIEPQLRVDKSASVTSGDAGDVVDFTITIDHSPTSQAHAYNATFSDIIPVGYTYVPASLDCDDGSLDPDALTCVENSGTITAAWTTFNQGETSIIKFSAVIDDDVPPGALLQNIANVAWTSMDGDLTSPRSSYSDVSTERTGDTANPGGNENDYRASDSADVRVDSAPEKYLIASSEAHTGVVGGTERLVIGEIVRYRLVTRWPEGVTQGVQIRENLPAGLQYINGTAKVALVSDQDGACTTPSFTSSLLDPDPEICGDENTLASITPTQVMQDDAVSNNAINNDDVYSSGTDVYFKFSNLNNSDRDASSEYILIEFNALVVNETANIQNRQLLNDFTVIINGGTVATSSSVEARVAEPNLTILKARVSTGTDAGDTTVYRVTVTNNSNTLYGNNAAAAFDLVITDPLNAWLDLLAAGDVVVTTCPAYATCTNTSDAGTEQVTVNVDRLNPGDQVIFTVSVRIRDNAPARQTIANTARVGYTSLPGVNGTTGNPTGSDNTGTPGASDGERIGVDASALNDYRTTEGESYSLNAPAVTKLAANPTAYPIGGLVVFPIRVTLPEGETRNLRVEDRLPDGLGYVSYQVITSAAASGGLLTNDYYGAAQLPVPTVSGGSGNGVDVTFTFGNTQNNPNGNSNDNAFLVLVAARVLDVSTNQLGVSLTNNGRLIYTNPNNGTNTTIDGGNRNITIVEPRIETTKQVDPTSNVENGTLLTYTVTFSNSGTSTAYEVTAEDTLAQGVTFTALLGCEMPPGTPVPANATPGSGTVAFGEWDIAINETLMCTYTATADGSLHLTGDHTNTIDADWSSVDGSDANERTYDDSPGVTVDGDQDEDDAIFTVAAPTLAKNDNTTTQATIADVIPYTITVGGPLGTLRDLVIVDTLPLGLIYNGDAAINGLPATAVTVSNPNDGSAPVMLTWNFGDAAKTLADATITFSARVANTDGNNAGDGKTNTVTLDHTEAGGDPAEQLSAQDSFTVIEPSLTVEKTIVSSPSPADAGGVVTYLLTIIASGGANTSPAYEISITDSVPAVLSINPASVSVGGANVLANTTTTTQLDLVLDTLLPGASATVQFDAVLQAAVEPGQEVSNTSAITYTNQPGGVTGERSGDGTPGNVDDYEDEDDAAFTTDQPTIAKAHELTSLGDTTNLDLAIGETITYRLAVTMTEGATPGVQVIDLLPDGMQFLGATIDRTGFNGSVPDPLVTGGAAVGDDITFDFGAITVAGDDDLANNTFGILVTARVEDLPGNVGLNPPGQTVLPNSATLQVSGSTAVIPSNTVNAVVVEPRLAITKTIPSGNLIGPDDIVTFQLLVENSGPGPAYDIVIEDPIPNAYFGTFMEGTTAAGFAYSAAVVGSDTVVRYTGGAIPAGGSATFTFTARVVTINPTQVLTNIATVTGHSTLPGVDRYERQEPQTDDSEDLTGFVLDLAIDKTDNDVTTGAGNILVYEFTVENQGNRTASGVTITESIPTYTSFDDPNSTPGWTCGATECTFTIATLPPGGWSGNPLRFAVLVDAGIPATIEELTNTVSIGDDGTNGPEVDLTDNDDNEVTPLVATPDLRVTKTDGESQVSVGVVLTYTITVDNTGGQEATGVELIDTLPDEVIFVDASTGSGGCGSINYTHDDQAGTVTWDAFSLLAGASCQFTVRVQVDPNLDPGVLSITNDVEVADDGTNGEDPTPENNQDEDTDELRNLAKALTDTSDTFTSGAEVSIGEVLTYQVRLNVAGNATLNELNLIDILDQGLAFVRCVSIEGTNLSASTDFTTLCQNPTVSEYPALSSATENLGRQVVYDFGTLVNGDSADTTLTVTYQVVVLDNSGNNRGDTLANQAQWTWTGGDLSGQSGPVTIVEPDLSLSKAVGSSVATVGSIVTYTLRVAHTAASDTPAQDVILTDMIPSELRYVSDSAEVISGQAATAITFTPPNQLVVQWDTFDLTGETTVIRFRAVVRSIPPGSEVTNTANLAWSSLPGDYRNPPQAPISSFNPGLSHERDYDPGSPVDIYGEQTVVTLTTPEQLPATGFAPGVVTLLPPQTVDYQDLGDVVLNIPALTLQAPLTGVPYGADGWDLRWLNGQVGYLEGTAFPTWVGNTGLTGHVYNADGSPGPFLNLGNLRWGDVIYLDAYGQRYKYEVRTAETLTPWNLTPLRHENYTWLTLLTCKGFNEFTNTYDFRIAVRAVLVSVEAIPPAGTVP